MTKSRKNPKVNFFFTKAKKWQQEFEKLRMIVLDCGLNGRNEVGSPLFHVSGK